MASIKKHKCLLRKERPWPWVEKYKLRNIKQRKDIYLERFYRDNGLSTIKRMLSDPGNGNTGALNKQETNLQSKKIKEDMYVDRPRKGNPEGLGSGLIKYLPFSH